MNDKLILTQIEPPEEYKNIYRITEELTKKHIREVVKKREDQILQKLSEHGYTFKNKLDLEHFAKTRCVLEKYDNKYRVLRVDGKIVCEWWETSRFDQKTEKDGTYKFTCIIGEPPK